jgi:hypothetical protein
LIWKLQCFVLNLQQFEDDLSTQLGYAFIYSSVALQSLKVPWSCFYVVLSCAGRGL